MDWGKYTPDTVRTGKDKNGNRLILQFSKDYKKRMGQDLDIGCPKCFRNDFQKYLKKEDMPDKKTEWKIKPMYEGVSLGFGSKVILSSSNITDELAEKFAREHKKGIGLFYSYPGDFAMEKPKPKRKPRKKTKASNE